MAGPLKVTVKPHFEPEFISVWLSMAEAFEKAAEAIRAAGERLSKLYDEYDLKAEDDDHP